MTCHCRSQNVRITFCKVALFLTKYQTFIETEICHYLVDLCDCLACFVANICTNRCSFKLAMQHFGKSFSHALIWVNSPVFESVKTNTVPVSVWFLTKARWVKTDELTQKWKTKNMVVFSDSCFFNVSLCFVLVSHNTEKYKINKTFPTQRKLYAIKRNLW